MVYYTALPVIFGVKKYADALWKVVKERGIHVNLRYFYSYSIIWPSKELYIVILFF